MKSRDLQKFKSCNCIFFHLDGEDSSVLMENRKSDFSDNSNNSSSGIVSGSSAEGSGSGSGAGVTGQSQSSQQQAAQQTMKDGTRLGFLIQELISTEENYIKVCFHSFFYFLEKKDCFWKCRQRHFCKCINAANIISINWTRIYLSRIVF